MIIMVFMLTSHMMMMQMFYSFALKHPLKPAKDDIRNINGYTPLTMTCLLGRDQIFTEIVELKPVVSAILNDLHTHHVSDDDDHDD